MPCMRPPARRVAALIAVLLVLTAPTVAHAASAPAQVGLVSFTGASLTSGSASLRVDWSAVSGATGYKVFVSSSYDGVAKATVPAATPTASEATLTGLVPGRDYFVQVSAVSSAGTGPRSSRVGHGTIVAEPSAATLSARPSFTVMSWNVCSVQCTSLSTRAAVVNSRIADLQPAIVVTQEAAKYTKTATGYRFAINGQNDIIYRAADIAAVTSDGKPLAGSAVFSSVYATKGKGVAWAALKDRTTGRGFVVFTPHLVTGSTAAQTAQREYEASRLPVYVDRIMAQLAASHGAGWKSAPVLIAGDLNTHKSRTGDASQEILEDAGWYDAYDQARGLSCQHCNSANPTFQAAPVIGVTWGDHVDKVLVRPGRTVVHGWANAGERSGGKFVTPLGSDHHPILVRVTLG